MSGQHTQGRLVAEPNGSATQDDINTAEGTTIATAGKANARRLAACWNYFDSGVSTGFIENDSFQKMQESFVRQRQEIQKLNANLGYYQQAVYYHDVPLYQVEHGGVVAEVTPIRVSAIVEELAAARALLQKVLKECEIWEAGIGYAASASRDCEKLVDRILSFLEGK
jgi:hypothetical protein